MLMIKSLMLLVAIAGLHLTVPPDDVQPESLPAGVQRTESSGLSVTTLPSYKPALAAAATITQRLSVSSLSFGQEGRLRGFTARYWGEQPLPVHTSFRASSVTVDANGILHGVTFAGAGDTGCDMVVTIEGNTVTYDCVSTAGTTACNTVLSGPSGGPFIIKYKCREQPQ